MRRRLAALSLALLALSCSADPDSAGRDSTPLPFRRYVVDGYVVRAFELYGLKCVQGFGAALTCVDTSR